MILGYRTTRLNENKHGLMVSIKKRPSWRGLNPLTPPVYVTPQVAGRGRTPHSQVRDIKIIFTTRLGL